eukprot:RCo028904
MASSVTRLALCQLKVSANKAANIENAVKHIAAAAKQGAGLVLLPECFNTPYHHKFFPEFAEEVPSGETCQAMRRAASENAVTVVAGSLPERKGDRLFNTSVTYGKDGSVLAVYRKIHLFKLNTEKLKFDESETLSAGSSLATFDSGAARVGVAICFDIRFPELAAAYHNLGTQLVVYPGAFNMVTGPAHWHLAARSRAVDTQQFVALCSPARDPDSVSGYVAYGHSLVVDPWGTVLAEAGEGEETVFADIDFTKVAEFRRQLPVTSGRRHDLFSVVHTPGAVP